jgi:hypothetical protein
MRVVNARTNERYWMHKGEPANHAPEPEEGGSNAAPEDAAKESDERTP